jgi:ABC-2 type transport system ATP-binding protein
MAEDRAPLVSFEDLAVSYGLVQALAGVRGAFYPGPTGLLGPNGAGKTTLLKTLLGFLSPDAGRMTAFGKDPTKEPLEVRRKLGYMPEQDCHIPGMSASAFVAFAGELSGLPRDEAISRAHEVLYYVGLGEARYRNVETYSTGMKQRIKLAQALAHDPELLFLDEPTNGMDPAGREEMLDLIGDLVNNHAVNVIVSSHVLPDIEATCSHVVVMDKGRVAASGPIAGLKQSQGQIFELRVRAPRGIETFVAALKEAGLQASVDDDQAMRVFVPGERGAQDIFALSAREGAQVRHLRPSLPTLEDVFAHAVGER